MYGRTTHLIQGMQRGFGNFLPVSVLSKTCPKNCKPAVIIRSRPSSQEILQQHEMHNQCDGVQQFPAAAFLTISVLVLFTFRSCSLLLVPMDILRSCTAGSLSSRTYDPIVITLLATFLVTLIARLYFQNVQRKKRLPPGPFAWPVVGNFPALVGNLPHRVLRSLATKYGGLMYLRLGTANAHLSPQLNLLLEHFFQN